MLGTKVSLPSKKKTRGVAASKKGRSKAQTRPPPVVKSVLEENGIPQRRQKESTDSTEFVLRRGSLVGKDPSKGIFASGMVELVYLRPPVSIRL